MPVVKNFDFNAVAPPPTKAPIERVTTMDKGKSAFDNAQYEHEPLHGGVGLYVWMFVLAGVLVRLMLAALGPATDPSLVMNEQTIHHVALAEALIDHHAFGLPLTEADVVASTLKTPHTLDEAASNIEQLRRLRGETGGVFVDGIKPQASALPGVPALIAALTLAGLPLNVLIIAQCLVGGLLAWPAFVAVGGVLKRRPPAVLAAALVALHPAMITASVSLDGTIWVAAVVILGLLSLTQTQSGSVLRAAGGGMAIGLAALIQPWTFFAAPALAAWRVLAQRSWTSAAMAAVVVLVAAAPPAAWMYRNHKVDAGIVLTTDARIDRAFGIPAAIAVNDPQGEFRHDQPAAIAALWESFAEQADRDHAQGRTTTQSLNEFALAQVFDQPAAAARHMVTRTRTLALDHSAETLLPNLGISYEPAGYLAGLIGEATSSSEHDPVARWLTEVWIGVNLALTAAMTMGLVVAVVRRNYSVVALVLIVWATWLVFTPSWIGEAARLPLIVVQAVAITALWVPAKPRRVKPPKRKAGDFAAAVPDAGFTIGPRARVAGAGADVANDEPRGGRPI